MNRIQLTGVLTKPPVVRETADGKKLCTICIAVNRNYANATGVFEDDYFHCVAWGGLADVVSKVFSTGSRIAQGKTTPYKITQQVNLSSQCPSRSSVPNNSVCS